MTNNTDESGDERFSLENCLPYRLATVTDRVSRVFAEHFARTYDLTIAEWRVLAVVAEHETLSPTVVGLHTCMDKVKVSRASRNLVSKGLLRQSMDPRDGRGRLLRLTRKGNTTHAGMVPLVNRVEQELFGELNRGEIATLNRILGKISTRLEMKGLGEESEAA